MDPEIKEELEKIIPLPVKVKCHECGIKMVSELQFATDNHGDIIAFAYAYCRECVDKLGHLMIQTLATQKPEKILRQN